MNKNTLVAALAAVMMTTMAHASDTIYSNAAGGDAFTNAGSSAANLLLTHTGSAGEVFTYRETKNNGLVGVNTVNPRSGNGSVQIKLDGTPGGKSEIAMSADFSGAGDSLGVLGGIDELSSFKTDALTNSSSVAGQAPIVRLELFSFDDGGSSSYGQLIYDTSWAGNDPAFTFGSWTTLDFLGNANDFYFRGTSGLASRYGAAEMSLSQWLTTLNGKGYGVLSMNAGMGTADMTYDGAVDNFGLGFGGTDKVYNFESVPEPFSMVGLASVGLLALRRKAKKA